jgi:hypothetical protein
LLLQKPFSIEALQALIKPKNWSPLNGR